MRSQDEIIRACALSIAAANGAVPGMEPQSGSERLAHSVAAATLAWVLRHHQAQKFAQVLADLEAAVVNSGIHFEILVTTPPTPEPLVKGGRG